MKAVGKMVLILSGTLLLGLMIFGVAQRIRFDRNCGGYLKRAAHASSVALAEKELGRAVGYLEQSDLTDGSTHSLIETPDTDISFWYQNLKSAHQELVDFPVDADHLTVSNHLMKLRETLVSARKNGSRIVKPPSITIYPYQLPFHVGLIGGFSGLIGGLSLMEIGSKGCC